MNQASTLPAQAEAELVQTTQEQTRALQKKFNKASRRQKWKALALVLPLSLFLFLMFIVPIVSFLGKSVQNDEVIGVLPQTLQSLEQWQEGRPIPDASYVALAHELLTAKENQSAGELMRRLNYEEPGYRSLISKTLRRLPLSVDMQDGAAVREALIKLDARWGEQGYWRILQRNASHYSQYYLLTAMDLAQNDNNQIVQAPAEQAVFIDIYLRTFVIALVVTLCTLLLAYPLAYLLATLPTRSSNLLMIFVLLPFWTSLLVRTAAWIVLLQNGGLINGFLMWTGIIEQPLTLVFNRIGVYISMVHIMLPFMVLPIYSVMKGISPTYVRAAISMGCHPLMSFWKVYFPQTVAGVSAGCLLVFISSIGYYITPALLGGPKDQMISYFIAFYTNISINWGLAAALGVFLMIATMVLYAVYNRLVGTAKMGL